MISLTKTSWVKEKENIIKNKGLGLHNMSIIVILTIIFYKSTKIHMIDDLVKWSNNKITKGLMCLVAQLFFLIKKKFITQVYTSSTIK